MKLADIKSCDLDIETIKTQTRILIVGDVGSGKTTIAKAIADEHDGLINEVDCANADTETIRSLVDRLTSRSVLHKRWIIILDELQKLSSKCASMLLIPLQSSQESIVIGCTSESYEDIKTERDGFEALISRLSYVIEVKPSQERIMKILIEDYSFTEEEAALRASRCGRDIRNAIYGNKASLTVSSEIREIVQDSEKFIMNIVRKKMKEYPLLCIDLLRLLDSFKNPVHRAWAIKAMLLHHKYKG